jgi:hypothetical protein
MVIVTSALRFTSTVGTRRTHYCRQCTEICMVFPRQFSRQARATFCLVAPCAFIASCAKPGWKRYFRFLRVSHTLNSYLTTLLLKQKRHSRKSLSFLIGTWTNRQSVTSTARRSLQVPARGAVNGGDPETRSHSCGDVVGYSRLAGSDKERTLAPLRAPLREHADFAVRFVAST